LYFNGDITAFTSEKKFRPYLTGGFGWNWLNPTDEGVAEANPFLEASPIAGQSFGSSSTTGWNFGVGGKYRFSNRIGLDFSFRDFVMRAPTFNVPDATDRDWNNNTQLQLGVNMLFGGARTLITHNFTVAPTIESSATSLCPTETATLRIAASDNFAGNDITYRWMAMGKQVSTEPQYTFVAPANAGPYDVGVSVFYTPGNLTKEEKKAVEKNRGMPVDRQITMNVKDYHAPTATTAVDRSTILRGERARLTSTVVGSECSGTLTYKWNTSEGRVLASPDQRSAEFDGSTIPFDNAIPGQQCKPATVTLEVTDQRGGVARDQKNLQVCYTAPVAAPPPPPPPPPPPSAIQLSDINFGANSARVNNCAKRVLGNEVYPQMASSRYSDYDVVVVGHRDATEKEATGKKPATSTLDRDRVLAAAAFLTAGGPTCKDLERTRVRAVWAGTAQRNDFRSNFCDGSTVAQRISSTDTKAQNRRVEIWLVPKGQELPGVDPIRASNDDISALGCPK
jgi:outer membrane protein OmpA-like peptidoglycan-associated protein